MHVPIIYVLGVRKCSMALDLTRTLGFRLPSYVHTIPLFSVPQLCISRIPRKRHKQGIRVADVSLGVGVRRGVCMYWECSYLGRGLEYTRRLLGRNEAAVRCV